MILAPFGFYHKFLKVTDDSCRKRERKGKSKKIQLRVEYKNTSIPYVDWIIRHNTFYSHHGLLYFLIK